MTENSHSFPKIEKYRGFVFVFSIFFAVAFSFAFPIGGAEAFLKSSAYWFAWVPCVLFIFYLLSEARSSGLRNLTGLKQWRLWTFLAVAFACLLLVHAEFGYKIAMDDYVLVATSQNFHYTREFFVPTSGFWKGGGADFVFHDGYIDKRPWLYPFIVSIVHDLTAFRVENAYLVNLLSVGVLMLAAFYFVKRVATARGAILTCLLIVSIPLIAQNATGAGIDMLNVTLLMVTMLIAAKYLELPSAKTEGLLIVSAILLMYSRYESAIYAIPTALIVALGWWRAKRVFLSIPAILSAPMLVGLILQNRIFRSSEALWELHSGTAQAFGFANIAENLPRALYFFFSMDGTLANAPWISALGVLSLLFFLLYLYRELRSGGKLPAATQALSIFSFFIVLNFIILLAYHDGKLDRLFASRLSLPFYLLLALAPGFAFRESFSRPITFRIVTGVTVLFLIGWTLPMNSKQVFTQRNFIKKDLDWLIGEVGTKVRRDDLVIDQYSTAWSIHKKTALKPLVAIQSLDWIDKRLSAGRLSNVYLVERLEYVIVDGKPQLQTSTYPEGIFDRSLLFERSFRPFSLVRVYRLDEIYPERLPDDWVENRIGGNVQNYTYTGL